jgi:hypothetical protein
MGRLEKGWVNWGVIWWIWNGLYNPTTINGLGWRTVAYVGLHFDVLIFNLSLFGEIDNSGECGKLKL